MLTGMRDGGRRSTGEGFPLIPRGDNQQSITDAVVSEHRDDTLDRPESSPQGTAGRTLEGEIDEPLHVRVVESGPPTANARAGSA
jgi:hypothetical protein